ncbi:MAG: hypothetical protein ABI234_07485 [Ktedonobacteraceae bacterium]
MFAVSVSLFLYLRICLNSLADRLELNGSTLQFNLTDALGSILTSLSSSAILGEQVYNPSGNRRLILR